MSSELGRIRAAGPPRELGRALGRAGRDAVHRHLMPSGIWSEVTAERHASAVGRMAAATRARFPAIWEEIEGLAEGLDLPVGPVMAWNCRGDLLASTPDGCTTVQLPGAPPVLGHNEDGLPFFRGACFMVEAAPDGAPEFRSFCYPGSLPGHTFAMTGAGLVQTVNNMRLRGVVPDVPRMVLGRAVLGAETLDAALALLREAPSSGGFHFTLAQVGASCLVGVEFGGGRVSAREIGEPSLHANHALHLPLGPAGQIVTASSRDRQERGETLLARGERDPLVILRDTGGPGLPIRRRDAEDPDDENTLGTLVVRIGRERLDWRIFDGAREAPAYENGRVPA